MKEPASVKAEIVFSTYGKASGEIRLSGIPGDLLSCPGQIGKIMDALDLPKDAVAQIRYTPADEIAC